MTAQVYERDIEVLFGEADLAGILYFPRLFHYCHVAMEGFFGAATGKSYRHWLLERNLGFPTVHTEADYAKPMPFGCMVRVLLSVRRMGSSSIDLRFRFQRDGQDVAEARSTVVCVVMDRFEKAAIPEDLREAFTPYVEAGE